MKTYVMVLLLGLCLIGASGVSEAALDWQIRWSDLESPQVAKVYIFNPESRTLSFSLETGDIAETSNIGPHAPYIIIGQDVSLQVQPGERKIFDILVYQDVDPYNTYGAQEATTSTLSAGAYQILLEGRPASGSGNSRQDQYPISSRGISLVPRTTPAEQEYNYRNERGYWKLILVDHDHVAEQLIRTGNRLGARQTSIQQAILYYTQGSMALSSQAESVFYGAFPELRTYETPPDCPACVYCGTLVPGVSPVSLKAGDVLRPEDPARSPVVFAKFLDDSVLPTTATSTDLLVTLAMKRQGAPPYVESRFLGVMEHDSELERVIQVGLMDKYSYCTIQDVVWYVNKEVSSLTEDGKKLWERVEGQGSKPPATCFGGRSSSTLAELEAEPENWKNLAVLFGAIVPFGVMLKRKGRK